MAASTFFIPSVNVIGADSLNDAMNMMADYGFTRTLIVTDNILTKLGMAGDVQKALEERNIFSVIYDGTQPNPTTENVAAGLKLLKENNCDSVISLGGGSPHDCAKGIALVAANGGDIRDYEGVDRSAKPQLPMIAINTTAGTASEMTRFCIITDEARHIKMAIVDKHVTPLLSVNDSSLMIGMPKSLTAATGMDALTHAIEAYVSIAATPITDACALKAVTMIAENLPLAVEDGSNAKAREAMAYASSSPVWRSIMLLWVMFMRWRTSWAVSTTCHMVYVMPFCCHTFRCSTAKSLLRVCVTVLLPWALT